MNKKIGIYAILVLMIVSMASSVLAASVGEVGTAVQGAINYGVAASQPIFQYIFGNYNATGNEFAINVLVFFLVLLVIYGLLDVIKIFGDKRGINFLISAIIALIGIRFMPEGFLQTMATPSSALVAVILLGLPFIILFLIGTKLPPMARRVMWVLYGVIILVLWIYNWSNPAVQKFNWIYPVFVVACFIAFWFDAKVQNLLRKGKNARVAEALDKKHRDKVLIEIDEKYDAMKLPGKTAADKAALRAEIAALRNLL